jgi:hypothetical protein
MKGTSRIFVTGTEIIATPEGRTPNPGNLVVDQFKALAARQFGMGAVSFELPARYAAVCHTETSIEPGIPEYRIPPVITAQTYFTVYDMLTGEQYESAAVDARGFVFSPSNQSEQTVPAESHRAIQFLYDPKNPGGLEGAMSAVLGGLFPLF